VFKPRLLPIWQQDPQLLNFDTSRTIFSTPQSQEPPAVFNAGFGSLSQYDQSAKTRPVMSLKTGTLANMAQVSSNDRESDERELQSIQRRLRFRFSSATTHGREPDAARCG
jgi:hypothetical protein